MDGSTTLPPPPPLAQLLDRGPAALFLDFDGTLVEIAPRPGDIHVPEGLLDRLHEAAGPPSGRTEDPQGRGSVLSALLADLDVPAAVEVALATGGDAVGYLLDVLRLRERAS